MLAMFLLCYCKKCDFIFNLSGFKAQDMSEKTDLEELKERRKHILRRATERDV